MEMKRTIVIGDVHGCLDELDELLKVVEYTEADRLIFCGDLIDRGPDSAGVVRRVMELKAECVKGNHEEFHLRYGRHEAACVLTGKKNPMATRMLQDDFRHVRETTADAEWAWLAALPNFIHIDDRWTVVHAGCMPDVPVEEQHANHLWRLRHVRLADMQMAPLDELHSAKTHAHWSSLWRGPRSIVYGHDVNKSGALGTLATRHSTAPTSTIAIPLEDIITIADELVATLGIDTGCAYGGKLTAAVFGDLLTMVSFVSVPARGTWTSLREERGP